MTEATRTIVERLRDAALFYRSNRPSVDHEKRVPRTQEITERECDEIAEREEAAIAEIERLQSELNTALERVKVLERVLTVALYALERVDGPIINHDGKIGLFLEKEANCSCSDAEREARAVLQSSGGK